MVSSNLCFVGVALTFALTFQNASASEFLRTRAQSESQQMITRQIIESTLSAELSVNSVHLERIEAELRALFSALPKNEQGSLEPAAVRYALHRYFVQKHGWYIKGLEPSVETWNASSPSSIMATRVPSFILSLFEERLHGKGMALHDLAVFAATLSDFVHNEALADTMDLYDAFGVSATTNPKERDVERVIRAYVLQLLDQNNTIDSMSAMHTTEQYMREDFPAWGDFQLWVSDVRRTIAWQRSQQSLVVEPFSLESVAEDIKELSDRLGAFQDIECKSLKGGLIDIEYKNTGRVLLSDFYRAGLKGEFLFNEHIDFLRRLGALDESDPKHPSVIIANYLSSQANCLASTSFHSVCCIDECEGLMGHLENSIAAPSGSPGQVALLVANLRSDTVDAPRNLTTSQLARLAEIADHHGGRIPLHGRLFAQWLHHVYPLECHYPHAAGTATPLSADEWMDEFGTDQVEAPSHERERMVDAQDRAAHAKAEALPWTDVEELVVIDQQKTSMAGSLVRKIAACVAVSAMIVPLVRSKGVTSAPSSWSEKSHLV